MKKVLVIIMIIVFVLPSAATAYAESSDLIQTGEKVVFKDDNWAYEKVNVYGWELDEYIGEGVNVSLPWSFAKEYVNSVGSHAFNDNHNVLTVDTTGVLESIGNYAFNGCSALTQITLYDSLSALGTGAFYGCSSLNDINLEDTSVTEIAEYCFAECGFSQLELPDTCTSIGALAFYNCSDLTKLVIPDSVTVISDNAFTGCDSLTIYCYTDSCAHEYAVEKEIPFVLLDAPVEYTFILGDADGDGVVTIMDATRIQRVLADLVEDTDGLIALRAANGEALSIMHATRVQRWLVDYEVSAPIGTTVTSLIPYYLIF